MNWSGVGIGCCYPGVTCYRFLLNQMEKKVLLGAANDCPVSCDSAKFLALECE
jgi:hypothetical protein